MIPEISFLLGLILDEELSPKVQKLCRKRIKDLETGIPQKAPKIVHGSIQAPSTQRLLEEAPLPMPVIPTPARIVGGQINNGDGTIGKRKF